MSKFGDVRIDDNKTRKQWTRVTVVVAVKSQVTGEMRVVQLYSSVNDPSSPANCESLSLSRSAIKDAAE